MDAKVTTGSSEQFKQAREALKMSLEEVATSLKLPRERIEEIEKGEYSDAISPTFYRGYIRTYANLLKIDPSDLLHEFNTLFGEQVEIVSSQRVGRFTQSKIAKRGSRAGFKWLTALILLAIVAAAAWGVKQKYFSVAATEQRAIPLAQSSMTNAQPVTLTTETARTTDAQEASALEGNSSADSQPPVATKSIRPSPVSAQPATATQNQESLQTNDVIQSNNDIQTKNDSQTNSSTQSNDAAQKKATQQTQASQVDTASSVAASSDALTLIFMGECWVDIKDANGERLAYGTKENGKVITLNGTAPFSLVLGDPSVVRIQYQGETLDMSEYAVGQTARLTVE